ncbi:MAG: Fpg/Nei family DNA glycosylase [Actinomycetota bacterium]
MPELPDVEHYRRFLARHAVGARVERVIITDEGILRNADAQTLDAVLRGERFEVPERRGKWLIAWTSGPAVLLHFGMTGDLGWGRDESGRHRHDRVIFQLDRGELRYRNMRKLGGVWLAHDAEGLEGILSGLGPDALALDRRTFEGLLRGRQGRVKAALMDQSLVAGVGNLLADEALWRARIHPARRIQDLSEEERRRLFSGLRRTIRAGIEEFDGGIRTRWMRIRGQPGARCPRCRSPLGRTVVGGRTTYFCPRCQPPPRQPIHWPR